MEIVWPVCSCAPTFEAIRTLEFSGKIDLSFDVVERGASYKLFSPEGGIEAVT